MEKNTYPKYSNILELTKDLPSEKALKDYLASIRWEGKTQCLYCYNNDKIYKYSLPGIYECNSCKKRFSVLQGTIFERTHITLDIWLWTLFEFCIGVSPSTKSAYRHTIEQKTAYLMGMRIRHSLWEEMNRKLSGNIYADEVEIGSEPGADLRVYYKRKDLLDNGKPTENTRPIFGMIEAGKAERCKHKKGTSAVEGGKVLLFAVEDKTAETLKDLVYHGTKNPSETNLFTDAWPSYTGLNYFFENHYVINRNESKLYDFDRYVRKVNGYTLEKANNEELDKGNFLTITTNPIENIWSHLTLEYRWLFGYSKKYTQLYLNEYMFRHNHKHLDIPEIFEILLKRCCNTPVYFEKEGKRKKIEIPTLYDFKYRSELGRCLWLPVIN